MGIMRKAIKKTRGFTQTRYNNHMELILTIIVFLIEHWKTLGAWFVISFAIWAVVEDFRRFERESEKKRKERRKIQFKV